MYHGRTITLPPWGRYIRNTRDYITNLGTILALKFSKGGDKALSGTKIFKAGIRDTQTASSSTVDALQTAIAEAQTREAMATATLAAQGTMLIEARQVLINARVLPMKRIPILKLNTKTVSCV